MKYRVTNKKGRHIKFAGVVFGPYETKIVNEIPPTDSFTFEKIEEKEEPKKTERRTK